jgi:hypothetical protein
MVDIIRKDNLTDLLQSQPTQSSGSNQPTPQPQATPSQGKPASAATGNNGETITLGQDVIKSK